MSGRVSLSRRCVQSLLNLASTGSSAYVQHWKREADELRAALVPKAKSWRAPAKKAKAEKKAAARAEKNAETSRIREEVFKRADGRCEHCGWSFKVSHGEMDHAVGRGKAQQTLENCWALCPMCHREKTNNDPSAAHWLEAFAEHCNTYGYRVEQARALKRLQFVRARAGAP
jgi:rubredoxin